MSIIKTWNDRAIRIREDRYVCLTDMAKASGKLLANWHQLAGTRSYLAALSGSIGIPIDHLVQINESQGSNEERGTWGHPKVAIRFAQWCSDEFAVQVDMWIDELLTTGRVELPRSTTPPSTLDILVSNIKALAEVAESLADLERRQREQEQTLARLIAEKEEAEEALSALPLSDESPAPVPTRGKVNIIVRSNAQRTNAAYRAIWAKLYLELYYRYRYDVKARCKNSGLKPLDQIEADDMMDKLHAIASEVLV